MGWRGGSTSATARFAPIMPPTLVPTNFTALDWAIVVVYLLGSLVIGVYAHRYVGRLEDYLVAGRALNTHLGAATMIASELGLITLMYMGQQGFRGGPAALHIAVAYFLCVVVIGATGFVVVRLRATGVMTVPEYYEGRYNKFVRWLGGLILASSGILNMGVFLQVDAKFLVAVTGMQPIEVEGWNAGAALVWVMVGMMAIVLLYTALGGMVSVIVTDLFQFIVLSIGMAVVTIAALSHVGWNDVFATVEHELGRDAFDPLASPEYGWAYVAWMAWISLAAGALWHSATLRALSARDPQVARRVFAWSSVGFLARFAIPAFWGLCAYVFVLTGPQDVRRMFLDDAGHVRTLESAPLAAASESAPAAGAPASLPPAEVDTLYAMPIMIGRVVPTFLLGIVCAGMLAASMSTYSSYLLCWSSVITQDIVAPLCRGQLSMGARIWLTRLWIVLIGLFLIVFGLLFYTPNIWKFLAGTGTIYLSGASAVVILGLYWKRASSAGAVAALLLGLLGLAVPFKDQLARFEWFSRFNADSTLALATVAASWGAMILLSLIFPDRPRGSVRSTGQFPTTQEPA